LTTSRRDVPFGMAKFYDEVLSIKKGATTEITQPRRLRDVIISIILGSGVNAGASNERKYKT